MIIDVVVVRNVDEIKLLCSLHEMIIMSKVMINHVILYDDLKTIWVKKI